MCEEININVNETNENINIISTEIVEVIDINVGETIEEVTFNITEEVIQVNINKVTGGGGEQTLAETLVLGNTTDGENISISNGDAIILDNGSMLKKGTIDAGNGGSKGIAQICGVGFEHKWEAGRLYIMNDGGTIIREVSHNLTYTPTVTDDVTKGFVQNTRWILDNGDLYVCTDPTEGAAVWEFITGAVPTLQQVTDEGNITSNDLIVRNPDDALKQVVIHRPNAGDDTAYVLAQYDADTAASFSANEFGGNIGTSDTNGTSELNSLGLSIMNNNTKEMRLNDGKLILGSSIDQPSIIMSGDGGSVNIKTDLLTDDRIQQVQDKDGTFAYLDDINQQKTTSYTADNGIYYVNNGIITVTDPVGEANKGYIVHVIGGTSTIGGVSYLPGALIYRYYKAGNWSSKNYDGNDTFVPYTGATQNIDLGEYELKAGQVELDQTPTGTAGVAVTRWNDAIGTSETTLKGGNVILKNGVDLVARVVNKVTPNTTLTKAAYQVVRISGAQGQRLAVNLAQANNDNNSADTLGIVTETIATNQEGFIMTVGQLEGINTTGSLQSETWADGDVLYLSPTTAGAITNIKPTGATGHIVIIGYVEYSHANNGKIYVKIMNGWELDELHNVYISSVANNQILTYESATSLWKNKNLNQIVSERRNANNTSNNSINYCGIAPADSLESASVWTITRLTITLAGAVTTASAINVKWTDRETTIYT
jgi:hypothetical protein